MPGKKQALERNKPHKKKKEEASSQKLKSYFFCTLYWPINFKPPLHLLLLLLQIILHLPQLILLSHLSLLLPQQILLLPLQPLFLLLVTKKLSMSPFLSFDPSDSCHSSESESELGYDQSCCGEGIRLTEVKASQGALQKVQCVECTSGPIVSKKSVAKHDGLNTKPYLFCESCGMKSPICSSCVANSKALSVNCKSVFANKCIGGANGKWRRLWVQNMNTQNQYLQQQ